MPDNVCAPGAARGAEYVRADADADGFGQPDFAALYRTHWRPLIRLAQTLVDDVDSAEDVVQDAFAALFRRQGGLDDPARATAYLRTCVVNGARSTLRRRRTARLARHLTRDVGDDWLAPGADHEVLLTAEHVAVRTALSALPRRQREVLGLRFVADLDDVEIAAVIGTSHANVRSAASRGLATLRTSLQELPAKELP